MILSGGYSMWYARWELRVYSGKLTTDGLVSGVDQRRAWVANLLANLGPGRVILITLITAGVLIAAYWRQKHLSVATATVSDDKPSQNYDMM